MSLHLTRTGRITLYAVLTALALVLSLVDSALPSLVPGVKLGLANIVTLYVLYAFGTTAAVLVLSVRILLGAVFAGQVTAFLYSMLGGAFSMLAMILVKKTRCSIYGVSVSGAAAHACGQITAAALLMSGTAVLSYLTPMLLLSLFTGSFSAFTVSLLLSSSALRIR